MTDYQSINTEQSQQPMSAKQLNNGRRVFDFLSVGLIGFIFFSVLVVSSIVVVALKGFNLGLDFTGGTSVEITLSQPIEIDVIRTSLQNSGYHEPVVQNYGSSFDVIIRLPPSDVESNSEIGSKISDLMHQEIDANAIVKRVEFVGPTVGEELAQDGILAIGAALFCILAYIALRFEWRFGTGAVVGLTYDVIITVGYLSFFEKELDLTIIAALLSVIGYSLNDTIIIFDRIRENFRKLRRASTYDIINISLTQTLSRTLMTSGTTLAVVICLYFFGGSMLKGFSETLAIGIVLGTVSTIYVAGYTAFKLGVSREHFMPPKSEAEGADQENILR